MRVLVIDDDPDCRQILELMLAKQGWTLYFAENGRDGLAIAEAVRPELILMDVLMPQMTGLDAVRLMKSSPSLIGTVIFAITALAFEEERRAAYAAGYDLVITKPFSRRQLLEAVRQVFPEALEEVGHRYVPPMETGLSA